MFEPKIIIQDYFVDKFDGCCEWLGNVDSCVVRRVVNVISFIQMGDGRVFEKRLSKHGDNLKGIGIKKRGYFSIFCVRAC